MDSHFKRNDFESVLSGRQPDKVPVWFMRQAGRVLPRYLKLRESYSFEQLMHDPQLACRVTLLPVEDLGVDAAILFSDILVIPSALGVKPVFTDKGPVFEKPLLSFQNPLDAIKPDASDLKYIYDAIDLIVDSKPDNLPLIGFCGGPLTVLLYMLQGIGTKSGFTDAEKFIFTHKSIVKQLVEHITDISLVYVENQIRHGVSCFRLFESNCGNIPFELYKDIFLPSVLKICNRVRSLNRKFLFFPKGIGAGLLQITPDVCDFVSLDWQTDIFQARKFINPAIGIEGNLDPRVLFCTKDEIASSLNYYKHFFQQHGNYIFNLGHGILPSVPFENAKFVVDYLKDNN